MDFGSLGEKYRRSTFGSIPITESVTERTCGVWVVNIVTAEVVAWLNQAYDRAG